MQEPWKSINVITRAAALMLAALVMTNVAAASPRPSNPGKTADLLPTAVAGESWLQHLRRSFDETSMGKTGRLGPPELSADDGLFRQLTASPRQLVDQSKTVTLHGADLYRMNCQGCHGAEGAGVPPEINSVINPVRATSAVLVKERMKAAGADMSWADATTLARQSRAMLLDRLHHGGQDMPAFPHLDPAEVDALVAYLRQLAGVPGAERGHLAVREQRVRIGEHITKSTCHVCHSAEGPNPSAAELYGGAIPPLGTLPLRVNQYEFVRKVTQGAPVLMGSPAQLLRGRMPVFYYLSAEEAEDVYLYLTNYLPQPYEALAAAGNSGGAAELTQMQQGAQGTPFGEVARPDKGQSQTAFAQTTSAQTTDGLGQDLIFALLLGLLASMVLGLGFWFSVHELRRLSGDGEPTPPQAKSSVEDTTGLDVELAA